MTRELAEVTVVGDDKKGIIARVTTLLFERGANVEDLDQAVQGGVFRMTLHVDTSEMVVKPETLREALHDLGDELGQDIQVRFPGDRDTDRIAVLVTKESHCLEALVEAREAGDIDAELSVVVGNHDHLADVAEDAGIPFYDIGDGSGTPDEEWLLDILDEHDVDLIVLARYMRILSPNVVFRYEDRIINVHPSLLPAFPGAEAYRQAREEGVRIAGVTAHYVTTDLDQGPIVAQRAFDVPDGASVEELTRRGQPLEADALVEAVKLHLDDALTVYHGRTHLRDEGEGEYQLGLSSEAQAANPEGPVDRSGLAEPSEADD
ncbi:formyltetrahydrofolate deformylase [Halomarina litorea]|uniref:formyltetrahydrofolate deformylase n=1 Tax=Halomarina litorea TaxID=2961595 RepID=UPI0020C3A2E2|nr:formyltetrahydrofolate deformylase [Halomarina sp. BCD28]